MKQSKYWDFDILSMFRDIKLSEVLGTELNQITKKVKDHIDDKLIDLVQFEMKEYPDNIFYKKDEIVLFRQDLKNKCLWCDYDNYWSFLKDEIGLSYADTRELTMCWVGEYLNCKQFSTQLATQVLRLRVGEHLNCRYLSK